MIITIIGSFLAVVAFCILIELPKKYMIYAGFTGTLCWTAYYVAELFLKRVEISAFIATIFLAATSHILARVLKAPVSIFLIPGILPIVPGGSIYRCAYAFINESANLNAYLDETFKIAGAIALAIFFVDSIFKLHIPKLSRRGKCRKGQ